MAGVLALFGIITLVMLGNLAQICIGALFLWLGEFNTLQEAVYHSSQFCHFRLWRHCHECQMEVIGAARGG